MRHIEGLYVNYYKGKRKCNNYFQAELWVADARARSLVTVINFDSHNNCFLLHAGKDTTTKELGPYY